MDRCKEPGAPGEPLYLDVAAIRGTKFADVKLLRRPLWPGQQGHHPGGIIAAYRNGQSDKPLNGFTINVYDDVTNLSLPITEEPDIVPEGTTSCKFWGLGSDGTVGANKNSIKIIGDHTDLKVQAYFQYDSRSPAASPSATCASVPRRSSPPTMSSRLTSWPATTPPTWPSIRWCRTSRRAVPS